MSAVYPIAPGTVGWMLWRAEAAVGGCAWIVTRIGVTDTGAILKEADTRGLFPTLADARARAEALNLPGA
jgi:hypothetical protein